MKMYFPVNIILFKLLLGSMVMIICSSNWLMLWISFELNTLFFLPFLKNMFYMFFSESMMKYFIIQSICSIGLILSWVIFKSDILIVFFIIMKMGLPPFHWWVLDFLKINHWMIFYYLMTIQKIGLFILLFYFIIEKMMVYFIIFSMIFSLILIYFFNNLLNIFLFSSMIHSSWLISSLFFSIKLWFFYLMFYMIIMMLMMSILENENMFSFSQYFFSVKWGMFFILMGLPPFSIFIMKWSISIFIMKWSISIFIMFMLSSFLSLYIYFKFSFSFNIKSFMFLSEVLVFYMFLIF